MSERRVKQLQQREELFSGAILVVALVSTLSEPSTRLLIKHVIEFRATAREGGLAGSARNIRRLRRAGRKSQAKLGLKGCNHVKEDAFACLQGLAVQPLLPL